MLTQDQIDENRVVVHRAWKLHYDHIQHSLTGGFYQGWDLPRRNCRRAMRQSMLSFWRAWMRLPSGCATLLRKQRRPLWSAMFSTMRRQGRAC
jgi:hypothetical protein